MAGERKAEEFFRAYSDVLRALGRGNEDEGVMTAHAYRAMENENNGRVTDAVEHCRAALDFALGFYGEKNETTRKYYRHLGDCLYSAEQYDKCAAIRKKYLDIVREDKDLEASFVAKAHELYANVLDALDDYEGAVSNRVLAVKMYRTCGNEYLESVAISLCLLGNGLRQLGDFKGAAEAYSEAKKMYEDNHFKYEKGNLVDLGIHQKLDECRGLVAGRLVLAVKMTKITPGGQAERLGVRKGDIWCSLDEWRASDHPDGRGMWSSLVKYMKGFKGKPRRLTVYRKDNGKWIKKSFLFDGGVGGFTYGYGVIPAADYDAMKSVTP